MNLKIIDIEFTTFNPLEASLIVSREHKEERTL